MIRICSKSSSYCGIEHSIVVNSKAVVVAEVEVAVEALGNADSSLVICGEGGNIIEEENS